jgi:[ribosomal protein S18]-alanine N-acetyltransferase
MTPRHRSEIVADAVCLRAAHNPLMSPSLIRVPPAQWPRLAAFILRFNQRSRGGVRCLHAEQGQDIASHAHELAQLHADEAAFWTINEDDTVVGVIGCEFDAALGRAWLRGPLVVHPRVLDAIGPLAAATVESALPAMSQFDAFPAADSARLNAWCEAAGYRPLQLHRILRAAIANAPSSTPRVRRATTRDLPAASALHQALFPSAYIGDADLQCAVDSAERALLVADRADATVAGYLYVQHNAATREAYIDYLGVLPSQRGQGLGRALLDAAAHWGAQRACGHLALTVREDRRSALHLYQRAGFVEVSAGRHWQKVLRSTHDSHTASVSFNAARR